MRANITSIGLGGVTNLAVLAPVKAGFVQGFESITYLERLRKLLQALQSARQNQRESELRSPVFPDSIGRFGIIHAFRYALVEPRRWLPDGPDTWLLSLNVTFDGGWEPYMRVIYRDLGPLLDALFCHCEDYPGSTTATFDDYCRWVRRNEIGGGLFYTESAVSLSDRRYLAEVERLQRETPHPERADEAIARYAVAPERQQLVAAFGEVLGDPRGTLALPVRALKGLYRLSVYFAPDTPDGKVLIRFAQSLLRELLVVLGSEAFTQSPLGRALGMELADEIGWLRTRQERKSPKDRLTYDPAALQATIFDRGETVTHGCVALLDVADADLAIEFLAGLSEACRPPAPDAIRYHVAFTHAGLQALRIAAWRLDRLPQEFVEGMEARCGLLGDVRGNHPDHWRRPLRNGATTADDRVDLTAVHVVVVLRLADAAETGIGVHPRLDAALGKLHEAGTGLTLLAVQPMRSAAAAGAAPRGHFGFADGLSQPQVAQRLPPAPRSDEVRAGELVLGYCNDRGDEPFPETEDHFLDNGSFLVMRKLRQRVDHLDAALANQPAREDVLERMMGRRQDGTPLVYPTPGGAANAFNYDADPAGEACPFASHVRRANPRDGREPMPRILRRGMSYGPTVAEAGPAAERGIVFMAYCASIAEQFETIQRWIAGGNSSGVSSSQADPFLAVPRAGEKRTFRYIDAAGNVARVDLGSRPFVELEWGLYLFVPSLQSLRELASFRNDKPPPDRPKADPPATEPEPPTWYWRRRLEDPDRSPETWTEVRAQPGAQMEAPSYGTLVGGAAEVLAVLQDTGTKYSVQGYGERMSASIGLNHLGIDHRLDADSARWADIVNAEIEAIDARQAFKEAVPIVRKVLAEFASLAQPHPDGRMRWPVDLIALSERVLARLCTAWVGLPEAAVPEGEQPFMVAGGRNDAGSGPPPRCPGQISAASRLIFSPHPVKAATAAGVKEGLPILAAVRSFMKSGRPRGPLSQVIESRLSSAGATADYIERAIAGVLLGFPPTVHGNFVRTMETWIDKDRSLWRHQQRLAEQPLPAGGDAFDRAVAALREPLLATMRQRPVPEMLWRCPVVDGKVVTDSGRKVVLGIASAMADNGPHELMFGGARQGALKTPHACPGYGMGLGVMLALIGELLDAGTLRPTGSPVLLMLTPRGS